MKINFYSWGPFFHRSYRYILLAMLLITGATLGILCAFDARQLFDSLMLGCVSASVSIVRLAFALLLPFFAVILAALYSKHSALFPICFIKMFCFSFCMMGTRLTCGSAGWMVCGLLMLSDAVSVLLLIKLSLRNMNGFLPSFGSELLWSILLTLGISVLDCLYIAPFLARIIKN